MVLLFLGGLFLLYDSFSVVDEKTKRMRLMTILLGLLLAVIGLVPLLIHYSFFDFLNFIPVVKIPIQVLDVLLVFYGAFLVVNAFRMK